ncbi:eukaryotic translation elongation factor 1 gamma [Carabus blaptoides fortunei]
MAPGTLYTYPENFRAYKALISAQYAGVEVKIAPNFVFGETNKTEAFLKKFPSGKVPAFETSEGKCLTDSNAIAYFVANEHLRGKTDFEKAQVLQWLGFADSEILPASCAWVFPILGIMQDNKQTTERAKEDVKQALNVLNIHLLTRTYLVSERISLADIIVACNLLHLYAHVMDANFRKPYGNVNRWFTTMINQPQFKAVAGEVKLCTKPTTAGDIKACKKEVKSCPKPAAKEAKACPKPAAKPEPAEELDAAEMALAAEPKSKNPFDDMPKGTFNFDDFKRVYSNEDEAKSIPYFWEKFDAENYSIWIGEYKYSEELAKVFMSCNLITGMFQRLDKMRKQAFASVCLFGEDNNSTISGIWVWRGQELAFPLSPDWQIDYESYNWTKLDASADSTKELVKQYFSWTGTDKSGKKFNQGKIFK